jgi:pimeloyl-ACP methyl ester carboxylesterase
MSHEKIVRANGVDLCIETFGTFTRSAILLVHGAGNSMLSWEDQFCERLAAGGRFVIRYDSRDCGRSVSYQTGAPPYNLRDLVADAIGLLDTLSLRNAHLVGISQGAAIGQLAALDYPGRLASLTLAASTPGGPGHENSDLPVMSESLRAFLASSAAPEWSDRAAVIEYMVESERPFASPSRGFDEAAMRNLAERVFGRAINVASQLTNPFLLDAGDPWRKRLGGIRAPTLVFHGTDDPLFPYEHALALANEIPGARLVALSETGHEYFPRALWDVVVPQILQHTSGR